MITKGLVFVSLLALAYWCVFEVTNIGCRVSSMSKKEMALRFGLLVFLLCSFVSVLILARTLWGS